MGEDEEVDWEDKEVDGGEEESDKERIWTEWEVLNEEIIWI